MIDEVLARIFINQWLVLVVVSSLLLLLAEFGYRFGRNFRRRDPKAAESHGGNIQGAVLGLLGLLLGFSFAMAVGRYDTRRSLVVDEANSIGTTWLRSDFLPPEHGTGVRKLLLDYAGLKIAEFDLDSNTPQMARLSGEIAAIHKTLWTHAAAACAAQPTAVTASFVNSLNETIDLHSSRMAAARNHVPGAVWLLLLVVAGCGSWTSGYGSGAGGFRSIFSQWIFPLLIGVVITLISDIDRPRHGMIGISSKPMLELLESLKTETP
jgi:hypothetical protein